MANRRMQSSPPATNTSKIHLHVEEFSQNTYCMLAEELIQPKMQESSPHNWVRRRKKKESGWDLCLWEGAVKEERLPYPGKPLHQLGDQGDRQGTSEIQRRGSSWLAAGRTDRNQHRLSWPLHALHNQRRASARVHGGWALRLRLQ